ncbi:MAG: MerR family transcriptional regulator [Oscillospiraceae bacterium]|nr:MerR family transcriptional regulator [Oscillospiraceae bacterium]
MKMQINEIAKLTGVSVRTLHYYDEIGLLEPGYVDEHNGYRFYDEKSLERMQEILFYRELDFPLKTIAEIISSPDYDKTRALNEQKKLLELKKQRIQRLIDALDSAVKGENIMNFKAFDNSEYEKQRTKYEKEAKEKWGDTDAYKESSKKTAGYSKDKWNEVNAGMDALMAEFAQCMNNGVKPQDNEAQELVSRWQAFITDNYYSCTKEVLAGLGQMYTSDERFMKNIDSHSTGTAEFMSAAIAEYCSK